MSSEGDDFTKSALAIILAKLDSMHLRIESLERVNSSALVEQGTSNGQSEKRTPSVQVEKGTPSVQVEVSSTPNFTSEQVSHVIELLNQQRVKEDRERIDRTGIPRILDNPPRNIPLPRPI